MGWGWSTRALESRVTAGIGVGTTETVPGSSVNGGEGDQEVGSIFDCKEGEYDISKCGGRGFTRWGWGLSQASCGRPRHGVQKGTRPHWREIAATGDAMSQGHSLVMISPVGWLRPGEVVNEERRKV